MDIFKKYINLNIKLLEKELEVKKMCKNDYSQFYQSSDISEIDKGMYYTMFQYYSNDIDILGEKIKILKDEVL